MEVAVLVKGVPRSETLRYDPVRRSVARDGAELVVNPFDQRALRAAVELRRPGDRLTAVSLGPAAVRALLREACAVGVDRAFHLCGDEFVGSDLLATSAAIASALRPLAPGLVVAGARSTDSDTGLLAPQVAARLGMPVVGPARSVRLAADRGSVRAEVDVEVGSATVEVDLPAVVTVGEKLGKPLPVSEEAFRRVDDASVVTVGAEGLGLSPAEVGAFGSPTVVEGLRTAAPVRRGVRCEQGAPSVRVTDALAALGPLLRGPSPPALPLPWPPSYDASREIVVLATDRHGRLDPEALGVVTFLRRALPERSVAVARYGASPDGEGLYERAGARGGFELASGATPFDSTDVADGLAALAAARPKLGAVVCLASPFGREVAGQLAARRSLGAITDVVGVEAGPERGLRWSKPAFGGTTVAEIRSRSTPVIVTIPPGVSVAAVDGRAEEPFAWVALPVPAPRRRVRHLEERPEPAAGPEPDGAEVVVAVGSGVGGAEGIAALAPVLDRWGASLVGTRRVVDAGLLPVRRQVGVTGRLLAPRLAVLLGVRGAPNHMVGWSRARAVLAVNRDASAPVFAGSDVGIVGTVEEVVPALAEPLARLLAGAPR